MSIMWRSGAVVVLLLSWWKTTVVVFVDGFCPVASSATVATSALTTDCRSSACSSTVLREKNRPKYNPFATLFGDMASSLLGNAKGSGDVDESLDTALRESSASTDWKSLRQELESAHPWLQEYRRNLSNGYGPASPLHKIRLYDKSKNDPKDVRVLFYRDSASWCPYCQKVWMALEEKQIPYRVEKVNMRCYGEKTRDFIMLQPNGQIPVAVIDGQTYGQSNDILYALEQLFPEAPSLQPWRGDEDATIKAQQLLRLERQLFSAWLYWLTGGRDPERYRKDFVATLSLVEDALQRQHGWKMPPSPQDPYFFMGSTVSMVDFMFMPFLERMCASLLFFKGYQIRYSLAQRSQAAFPAVNRWFDAMETLDSYRLTKSDYYTHCWDLPPQLGGCTYEDSGLPYENAINGVAQMSSSSKKGSWEFPLQPDNGGVEPDWHWISETEARAEAVERLTANYAAVVPFAARGAGTKGMPPYSAVLADPNATPNPAVLTAVDASLRWVASRLLHHDKDEDEDEEGMSRVADLLAGASSQGILDNVIASLAYLRDRVGVPRDMSLPAARQFRATLNWAIGILLEKQDAAAAAAAAAEAN